MSYYRSVLVCVIGLVGISNADARTIKTFISSGTGFYVNRHGYALTNLHVVQHCERIVLGGSGGQEVVATILAKDSEHDLALLKTQMRGNRYGVFRPRSDPLDVGERVVLIGYPGESFKSGQVVTREAEILSLAGPKGEDRWIQLSDVITQGNSGGPILDSAGNVVGVAQAKAVIYTYPKDRPEEGKTTKAGIAISQPVVEEFLRDENVPYDYSSRQDYQTARALTGRADDFIINVRCEYRTEVR